VKQFLLNEAPDKDGIIRLTGKDYRYLVKVRRLKQGTTFTALLPGSPPNAENLVTVSVLATDGFTLTGSVAPASANAASTGAAAVKAYGTAAFPPLILFQGLAKEPRMDLIVRQAGEGGLSEVVPFYAEHSIPQPRRSPKPGKPGNAALEAKAEPRVKRWERIIKEARQQSGSAIDTQICAPLAKEELFDYWKELLSKTENKALGLVFCLASDLPLLPSSKNPLAQGGFHRYLNKEPPLIVLAIGPEGGFSASEIAGFIEAGFKPVNMGEAILRVETASCYAAAAVKITLMEKAFWTLKNE
jgi:16S rRNA (uracil1498-N3)-methyltransferase